MREYEQKKISLYELLDGITTDGEVAYKFIEYDNVLYSWNGYNYVDFDDVSLDEIIDLSDCKKPMIKLLDYVYDTVIIDTVGKLGDGNE